MWGLTKEFLTNFGRYLLSLMGIVLAFLEPTAPFIFICTLAVLFDCYTVKKKYPGANDGKFKSNYAGRVFGTLIKVYALTILAYLVQIHVLEGLPIKLPNIVAAAVCFWQVWSMLENESSCNDAKWAKIAQRILVDKTERHFEIDLSELKEKKDDGES